MTLNSIQRINSKLKEGMGLVKAQGILIFSKEASQYVFWELLGNRIVLPLGIRQFKKKMQDIQGIDAAVDFAFSFNYFGLSIRPGQFKCEIKQLLNSTKEIEPKRLLEIGTAKGGTLFLFSQIASCDGQVLSIDLPGGKFGGGYAEKKIKLYHTFAKDNQKIILLRKNAHEINTLNEVKSILSGQKLDFLFIDGDHTYEGVKMDFEMYSPLVRRGGIVGFHDIAEQTIKNECEVNKFWNEIKRNYKYREFIYDLSTTKYGVGLIYI